MNGVQFIIFSALMVGCFCQRSPYAGRRPIGFPEVETTTTSTTTTTLNSLGNRFDNNNNTNITTTPTTTTTTQRLPIEALGDRNLFNRLGQLPQDAQPFWYLNWQALEANRNRPQTFQQSPNGFIDRTSSINFTKK